VENLGLRDTNTPASESGSFEELHEQVGVLEQRALGELETALEAISDNRETLAEPPEGKEGLRSFEKRLWRDLPDFPDLYLICVGLDRRIIFINDAMLKSLGCVAEEMSGVDVVRMLFPEPEQEKGETVFSRLLATEHPLSFETQMHSRNRAIASVCWQMRLVRSPDKRHEYFLGIGMRKAQPTMLSHTGAGLLDIGKEKQPVERESYANGDEIWAKKPSHNGFHSRWAYVIVYFLTSASICVLGALSGPKAVYYNGWLVLLQLTRGLHQMDVPSHDFMFGQGFLGDYALMVGAAIFFVMPGLVAVALVNAVRSFKRK
jgi:PAS domain S-box-containing protein